MSYTKQFKMQYINDDGISVVVNFYSAGDLETDFGGVVELRPGKTPYTQDVPEGVYDSVIQSTGATMTFFVDNVNVARSFFTADPLFWMVEIWKDDVFSQRLFVNSEIYNEDYSRNESIEVTLELNDGLKVLDRFYFNKTVDYMTIQEVLAEAFSVFDLYSNTSIFNTIELYSDLGFSKGDYGCDCDGTYFNKLLVNTDNYINESYEYMTMYEVVEAICGGIGLTMFVIQGKIIMIHPDMMGDNNYSSGEGLLGGYSISLSDGEISTIEDFNTVKSIPDNAKWYGGDQSLDIEPAKRKQIFNYSGYGYDLDISAYPDWTDEEGWNNTDVSIDEDNDTYYDSDNYDLINDESYDSYYEVKGENSFNGVNGVTITEQDNGCDAKFVTVASNEDLDDIENSILVKNAGDNYQDELPIINIDCPVKIFHAEGDFKVKLAFDYYVQTYDYYNLQDKGGIQSGTWTSITFGFIIKTTAPNGTETWYKNGSGWYHDEEVVSYHTFRMGSTSTGYEYASENLLDQWNSDELLINIYLGKPAGDLTITMVNYCKVNWRKVMLNSDGTDYISSNENYDWVSWRVKNFDLSISGENGEEISIDDFKYTALLDGTYISNANDVELLHGDSFSLNPLHRGGFITLDGYYATNFWREGLHGKTPDEYYSLTSVLAHARASQHINPRLKLSGTLKLPIPIGETQDEEVIETLVLPDKLSYTADFSDDIDGWTAENFLDSERSIELYDEDGTLKVDIGSGTYGDLVIIERKIPNDGDTSWYFDSTDISINVSSTSNKMVVYGFGAGNYSEAEGLEGTNLYNGYSLNEEGVTGSVQGLTISISIWFSNSTGGTVTISDCSITATPYSDDGTYTKTTTTEVAVAEEMFFNRNAAFNKLCVWTNEEFLPGKKFMLLKGEYNDRDCSITGTWIEVLTNEIEL